tara:strand:+ start:256 stop:528 length:273 start_codon:yes stop_codon:yes gene_type:complete
MARLLIKGAEEALGANTGAAKIFSNARLVRVVNTNTSNAYLVTLVASVGGAVIGSFTLAPSESVELVKDPLNGIFAANSAVKGAAVGYSN